MIKVINLKRRKDRRDLFLSQVAPQLQDQTIEWVEAVDGLEVLESDLINFKWGSKNIVKKKSAYGCYKSHCKAIQQGIEQNSFPLLILEDDVKLQDKNQIKELFTTAPEGTTLLYFGGLLCNHWALGGRRYTPTEKEIESKWVQLSNKISIFGGHAYGFKTREAAEEVLAFIKNLPSAVDNKLTQYRKLNPDKVRIFLPFQFVQRKGYSDIEGKVMDRN